MRSYKNLFVAVVLITTLTGCNRGCTTRSTLDVASKTVHICGEEATVTVRFIESRNSRRVAGGSVFNRDVTYRYGLAFDLKTKYWEKKEVMYEAWPAEDEPDLDLQIERFKVRSADDNAHFAFGIDYELYGVFHVIGVNAFSSRLTDVGLTDGARLSQVKFDKMEKPESILYRQVLNDAVCMVDVNDQANIQAIFDDLSPTSRIQMLLLGKWPSCYTIEQYFTDEKIVELAQNSTWKQAAIDRCLGILHSNNEAFSNSDEAMELLAILDNDAAYFALDTFYVSRWGNSRFRGGTEYIFERLISQDLPMQLEVKTQLIQRADEAMKVFYATGDDPSSLELEHCIQLYLLLGQGEKIARFLDYAYTSKHFNDSYFEIKNGTFGLFEQYSKEQQEFILRETQAQLGEVEDYLRSSIFESLENHLECTVLSKYLEDFADDLKYAELPERCNAQ